MLHVYCNFARLLADGRPCLCVARRPRRRASRGGGGGGGSMTWGLVQRRPSSAGGGAAHSCMPGCAKRRAWRRRSRRRPPTAGLARAAGTRLIVTLECTEARAEGATPSRYVTQKVRGAGPARCGGAYRAQQQRGGQKLCAGRRRRLALHEPRAQDGRWKGGACCACWLTPAAALALAEQEEYPGAHGGGWVDGRVGGCRDGGSKPG